MSTGTLSTGPETSGRGRAAPPSRSLQLTWLVARREIQLRAKTRVFVVTTAILLIAVALAVSLPAILSAKNKPDRIGVVGDTAAISGIVTEAGRLAGGQAVAVPQPSLAAAEAALRSGDLSAVLVPNSEIIVEQVPLAGLGDDEVAGAHPDGLTDMGVGRSGEHDLLPRR